MLLCGECGLWLWLLMMVHSSPSGARSENTFNFTYSMAQRCKEHVSSDGYSYSTFYRITSTQDNDTLLDMHVAVLAPRDGHILLSTRKEPSLEEPVYEIVLGGGANRFSEIRRQRKRNTKRSQKTVDILSPIHFRAFWIKITDDGAVDVGREGDELPFLHYEDPDPLPIKYFSFATWTGVEAKFLYDCPDPALYNTQGSGSQSEMTPLRLTTSQRLLSELLSERSVLTPPNSTVSVVVTMSIAGVSYDPSTRILRTLLAVVMGWDDDQMKWDPAQYNGTTTLVARQMDVWKPELYVHNSVDIGELISTSAEPIYIRHTGALSLRMRTEVSSWCEDDKTGASGGFMRCLLVVAPWEQHEQIRLVVKEEDGLGFETDDKRGGVVGNSWRLEKMSYALSSIELSPYSKLTCAQSGTDQAVDTMLLLQLHMRQHRPDKQALLTPLLVCMVSLVVWLSPARPAAGDRARLCLPGVMCVLLSAIICTIQGIPSNIVLLYEIVLVSSAVSLVSGLISRVLSEKRASRLSRLLCCTTRKTYSRFSALEREEREERETRREEMLTEEPAVVRERVLFVIDCILSLMYSVAYALLLAHYW